MKKMKSEKEIKEVLNELEQITGFISEYASQEEIELDKTKSWNYACNVSDALRFVVEDYDTVESFLESYVELPNLKKIADALEVPVFRLLKGL